METIETFFHALDAGCDLAGRPRPCLHVIGSAALMFQTDYERGTRDSDVIEAGLPDDVRDHLVALGGRGSPLARKHGLFLDVVNIAIVLVPQRPRWHRVEQLRDLKWFEVVTLDVVDVVVSKLKRFSPRDREDITAMVARGLVAPDHLVDRFKLALDLLVDGAYGADAPKWVANLHRVQREDLRVEPTEIELPSRLRY